MSIVIGADIVPTQENKRFFCDGNVKKLLDENLYSLLQSFDYRVFNLETPLVDIENPIPKHGPLLRAESFTVNGLKALNVDLLTLANNHIFDHGEVGLQSTLRVLSNNHINYFGVAENKKLAAEPFVAKIQGKVVGFYGCVEHEFSVASENKPGANPFDALNSFEHVFDLKRICDYVVVLYHGGKEFYQYPSPVLRQICRKFVEKGADLVICQHSHCIGCEEKFLSGRIIYGQGNFLFDTCNNPMSRTSLLIKIDDCFRIEYIPIEKKGCGICLSQGENAKKILSDFFARSELVKKNEFVENEYKKFADNMLGRYLLTCSGYKHNLLYRFLNKLTGSRLTDFFAKRYSKQELLAIRNYIECESHRELFIEGLKNIRH